MRSVIAGLAILTFGGLLASASGNTTLALTPTPPPTATATATPSATPFPPGTTLLRARVVDDRNANGIVDAGEAGLAGWEVVLACGDALFLAPLTDANGATMAKVREGITEDGVRKTCVWVRRQFGWLPTSPASLRPPVIEGQINDVAFLLRYLGPSVMETYISVIRRGIPTDASLSAAAPFDHCVEHPSVLASLIMIVGAPDRPGCPIAGAEVQILANGERVGSITFASGRDFNDRTLVIGGDSMRLTFPWNDYPTDPGRITGLVNGVDCAVVEPHNAFPVYVSVYVLSDEARPGCGRPGDVVRFYHDGIALEPTVEWRAGPNYDIAEFLPATRSVISPPSTGSAGLLAPQP